MNTAEHYFESTWGLQQSPKNVSPRLLVPVQTEARLTAEDVHWGLRGYRVVRDQHGNPHGLHQIVLETEC
jgi:hypothetical protein